MAVEIKPNEPSGWGSKPIEKLRNALSLKVNTLFWMMTETSSEGTHSGVWPFVSTRLPV
jgi:hypothetical protein